MKNVNVKMVNLGGQYRSMETTPLQVEIKSGVKNVTVNVEGTVKEEVRQR